MKKGCKLGCRQMRPLLGHLWKLTEDTDRDGLERGLLAYQSPKTCKLKVIEECKGGQCDILFRSNPLFVAGFAVSFHTHPVGGTTPSSQDLLAAAIGNIISNKKRKERLFCIGSLSSYVDDSHRGIRCHHMDDDVVGMLKQDAVPGTTTFRMHPWTQLAFSALALAHEQEPKSMSNCLWSAEELRKRFG